MKLPSHPWRFLFSGLQLLILIAAVASGSSAAADETTYRRALEAIDGQDWTGAARLLRVVIFIGLLFKSHQQGVRPHHRLM